MDDSHIAEKWRHLAVAIGDDVFRTVNALEDVGTDDETGYILMFFNTKNHKGKSTLVSSYIDRPGLKKLLKDAILAIDTAKIVEPTRRQ